MHQNLFYPSQPKLPAAHVSTFAGGIVLTLRSYPKAFSQPFHYCTFLYQGYAIDVFYTSFINAYIHGKVYLVDVFRKEYETLSYRIKKFISLLCNYAQMNLLSGVISCLLFSVESGLDVVLI